MSDMAKAAQVPPNAQIVTVSKVDNGYVLNSRGNNYVYSRYVKLSNHYPAAALVLQLLAVLGESPYMVLKELNKIEAETRSPDADVINLPGKMAF